MLTLLGLGLSLVTPQPLRRPIWVITQKATDLWCDLGPSVLQPQGMISACTQGCGSRWEAQPGNLLLPNSRGSGYPEGHQLAGSKPEVPQLSMQPLRLAHVRSGLTKLNGGVQTAEVTEFPPETWLLIRLFQDK